MATKVAERDGFKCQMCGKEHVELHVHHIKPFSEIVSEILFEHPDLHPDIEDEKMQLYKICVNDSRFTDLNNLTTLCKECHLFKVHGYNKRTISSQASGEEGSETISLESKP